MTEDFNLEAFRYLLDELDVEARARFEAHLAQDPFARAALRACSGAVAQFARETARAEAMTTANQRAALAGILSIAKAEPRAAVRHSPWRRFAWPIAAGLLLFLNLAQFFRPPGKNDIRAQHASPLVANGRPAPGNSVRVPEEKNPLPKGAAAEGNDVHAATPVEASVTEELHRLEKLRSEYASLERARAALSLEYDGIIRELAQRALVSKGVGRLAAMELVDAGSYARGERKGLVDIARGILTEPGIVTIEPPVPISPKPPTAPNADQTPTPDPLPPIVPQDNASTVNPKFLVPNPPTTPTLPQTTPPSTTNPPSPDTPEAPPQTSNPNPNAQPYAWSVFDETASRGYLNLYNLPVTPADQSLQLWVKPANSNSYQRMGEVPSQFYGGSGSLYYNLPGATQTPSEILITKEPRNAMPVQPTGPTVLHGP